MKKIKVNLDQIVAGVLGLIIYDFIAFWVAAYVYIAIFILFGKPFADWGFRCHLITRLPAVLHLNTPGLVGLAILFGVFGFIVWLIVSVSRFGARALFNGRKIAFLVFANIWVAISIFFKSRFHVGDPLVDIATSVLMLYVLFRCNHVFAVNRQPTREQL